MNETESTGLTPTKSSTSQILGSLQIEESTITHHQPQNFGTIRQLTDSIVLSLTKWPNTDIDNSLKLRLQEHIDCLDRACRTSDNIPQFFEELNRCGQEHS